MDPEEVFVPIAFFGMVFLIIRTISTNRLKRRIIDAGVSPEMARALLGRGERGARGQGALKWGLVIGAVGLALLAIGVLSLNGEPFAFGLVTLSAGAGLLVYYVIARRDDSDFDLPWRIRVERTGSEARTSTPRPSDPLDPDFARDLDDFDDEEAWLDEELERELRRRRRRKQRRAEARQRADTPDPDDPDDPDAEGDAPTDEDDPAA
jgi:hypothetical protein